MTALARAALLLSFVAGAPGASAADRPWVQYRTPEEAGFSSERLEEVRQLAESAGSAAVFAVVGGKVLAAWGEVERPLECHSVRKSVVSALVGTEVDAGRLDLDATIEKLGIDDVPPLSADEKKATVRDLLASRSGVYHTAAKEPDDMKAERPPRGSSRPGERFFYNNWDFNTIGVIFERVSEGKGLFEEFERRLARPLGMEDFRLEDGLAELEPSSSIHPAHAFDLSARDLARLGWLYAKGGEWDGRRVLSAAWVRESTTLRSDLGGGRGYGYMWWVYPARGFGPDTRLKLLDAHDKFGAVGTGGQFLLVVPDLEFVFVHRADTERGRAVRSPQIWGMAERILGAREGNGPKPEPAVGPLAPVRFPGAIPATPRRTAVPLEAATLPDYLGRYAAPAGAPVPLTVRIHVFRDRLFALAEGQGEVELFQESRDVFFARATDLVVRFERDAAGRVSGAGVTLAAKPLRLERTPE